MHLMRAVQIIPMHNKYGLNDWAREWENASCLRLDPNTAALITRDVLF